MNHLLAIGLLAVMAGTLPAQQPLVITHPAAGALVPVGTRCSIGWVATNLPGRLLKIEVNMAGASPNRSIANLVPVAEGHCEWDIPWEVPPTNPCQVHVAIFEEGNPDAVATADGPEFSLVSNPAPALLVRAPAGGEQWPRGTTRSVSWEPHNLTGTLTLELLQGGNVVSSVADIAVASNRCHYTLPADLPTGSNYTIRLTSAAAPAVSATSRTFQTTDQAPPRRKWTMLLYLDADCFMMDEATMESMADLGRLPGSTNVNYLIQVDRSPRYAADRGNWDDTKRFVVKPGFQPTPAIAVQSPGELNMSSPQTLTDFINWGTENFPAENYFLILSDHGDGWYEGQILDESNGGHNMPMKGLPQALNAADEPMTILGLDMCLMGQIEVAHQVRNTGAKIIIASQYVETRNWPYLTLFRQLQDKFDTISPEGLAILFCDGFVEQYSDPTINATLAATRLNKMDALTASVARFAEAMSTNSADRAAVRQQASAVKTAFHDAVFYCARSPILERQVYGLNINFPTGPTVPQFRDYNRELADFAGESHWKGFLNAYMAGLTNSWIAEARAQAKDPGATEVDLFLFLESIQPESTNARVTFLTVGDGLLLPATSGTFPIGMGESLPIVGFGAVHTNSMADGTNHFVRWVVNGQVELVGDPLNGTNTLKVNGDGLVMAFFAENKESYGVTFVTEGNGSLNGASEVVLTNIPAGGSCPTITAVAEPGYTFAGWGGDYPASANPFTLTNVQADMTVIAYFWPARPTLSIERQPGAVMLTWPATPPGYVLESTADAAAGPWTPVPNVSTNHVTLPLASTNRFFRLYRFVDAWKSP